ncbi:MAG TPA: M13 family metallopeptidase [Bryobacteraceae bacterium]|nr:M13 family metallopeptidase [Bryobacteraceae bacterium]
MQKLPALLFPAVLCLAQSGRTTGIDRSMLDPSCKPCDDFWRYATGGWNDAHPIPADRARWGTFNELADGNLERLRTILDAASSNRSAKGDEKRVGDFYASCMDTAAIEAAGIKPLKPLLDRVGGIQSRDNLVATLVNLELEGGLGPLFVGTMVDPENSSRMITGVGGGGLSLPDRDYYVRDDARSKTIRDEFVQHVQRTLALAGDAPAAAQAASKTILDFETILANATLTNVARRDPYQRIHKMNFAGLEALAPTYDWNATFRLLNLPTSITINVTEPEFLKVVNRQIQETPAETWKTWLRWRVLDNRSRYLAKAYFDEWFRFDQTVLSGVGQQLPRWKVCVNSTDATLGEALGRMYVEKYFPPAAQRRMQQLVENLRQTLGEELKSADWLAADTRTNALRKLQSFDPRIGFPVKWHDYSSVTVTRNAYLASKQSAALEQRRFNLAKAGKAVDRTEWNMTPPTVNAYYNSVMNSITFPAGILQYPFFDLDADDAVNYGAIGAVIGHEMGHGFDDQGSKFDADGNLKNWWTDQDRAKFEVRAACVTNQFDSIDVGDGMRHTGKLVTGEAMGDLGGVTLAYKAYHRALQGKEAPIVDGFTGDQRFFLAFARVWSGTQRPEAERRQLATDPHPLAKFRANATLQNLPEFHAAFACKLGDAMVRPAGQQCRLW